MGTETCSTVTEEKTPCNASTDEAKAPSTEDQKGSCKEASDPKGQENACCG